MRDESDSSFVPYDLSWSPASTAIAFSGLLRSATGVAPWVAVVPAAGGEMRLLAPGSEPDWAADGRDLVYVAHERESDSGFRETRREIARVDSSGSAVQILTSTTPAPRRNAVEVRRTEGGRVVAAFDLPVLPNAVALSHGRLAMLVSNGRRHAIEVRALGGSLVRKFAVPKPSSDEIFMSGRWIVFRTQSTVRGIDLKSGRRLELSKARGPVIGLSIDGRRVAWAEQGRERSRIQTLLLPG